MGILEKLNKFIDGKKTYIVAIVGGILVGLQLYGVAIPEQVWTVLGLLGLGSIRSAITKSESK